MANQFTTKEVLNKVLLDSSGNSVAANSHTSQEALNAVLDTSNNRLNVSLGGSNTISGDVTITGDLTVQGGGSLSFDEIIEGTQVIDVDSAEALLVRKNGDSGDVFIVDTQNSRVGVGGAPSTDVEFFNTTSDTASQLAITSQSSGGNASALILRSNRNNTANSHTVVTNGQFLGQILFQGSDGTDYEDAARIFATVDGSPAGDATDMPGSLNFATTADGSDSMTTHMKIDDAGNVLIGTSDTYGRFYVQNNVVDQTGLLIKHAPASTSTASVGNISADNSNATATNGVLRVHHEDPPANVKLIQADTTASNTVKFSVDEDGDGYYAGGLTIANGNLDIAATKKLFFDAGGDTYIHEQAANKLDFFVGNGTRFVLDANSRVSLSNNDSGGTGGQDSTSSNTTLGYKAGNAIASGTINNTFIGHNAGLSANDAVANVLIGTNTADALTTGDHNVAIGYFALSASTDVDSVVAIGSGAMESGNVTSAADGGIAIGRNSLLALTSGAGNTAVGMSSLMSGTGFSTNTALGFGSGKYLGGNGSANASSLNTCIGAYSMGGGNQTTPSDNTANQNTAIGHGVLGGGTGSSTNITAIKNVGVGYAVMNTVTTAQSNSILGYTAGIAITSGNENVAVGSRALGTADTATFNVAVGGDAMFGVPTGQAVTGVVAVGLEACKGDSNTTNAINHTVAVGRSALKLLRTGGNCTAVGYQALEDNLSGYNNTALGYQALANATGGGNSSVGSQAGDLIIAGTNNTLLGSASEVSANNAVNQAVIGQGATGQADNSVTLGNASATHLYLPNNAKIAGYGATTVADDATITVCSSTAGSVLVSVYNISDGYGMLAWFDYASTGTKLAGGSNTDIADTDTKICLISASNNNTITFKNRLGSSKNFHIVSYSAFAT